MLTVEEDNRGSELPQDPTTDPKREAIDEIKALSIVADVSENSFSHHRRVQDLSLSLEVTYPQQSEDNLEVSLNYADKISISKTYKKLVLSIP